MTGPECLDLEDLAAFADGELTGDERRRAIAHLADCQPCYEVFAEVTAFQEEEARGGTTAGADGLREEADVIVHPRARRWGGPALGGLAAAAALALVVIPWMREDGVLLPDPGWDGHQWSPRIRGVSAGAPRVWPAEGLGGETASFRLGVRMVDLRVALRAGRADRALAVAEELEALLQVLEPRAPPASRYRDLRRRLAAGEPAEGLLAEAREAEGLVEDWAAPRRYYRLGRWVEEGRAAAITGRRRFFTSRETARFLDEMAGVELAPEGVAVELEKVRTLVAGRLGEDALKAVLRSLDRIDTYAGGRQMSG